MKGTLAALGAAFAAHLFGASMVMAVDAKCTATYGTGSAILRLATGSPGELGLLEVLAAEFTKREPVTLCWVKAGSGKSLELLKAKAVDLVLVHAPAAERKAVAEGWAVNHTLIGSNEFYVVGPVSDPARIGEAKSAAEAYRRIAASRAPFLSRGDNSGTHKKELSIWKGAGVEPAGDWYVVTHTFMMATLRKANELPGYFMTDSSTWVAAKKEVPNLTVLFRGDPVLVNTYYGLTQPPGAMPAQTLAGRFLAFVAGADGQRIIASYGKERYGEGLYNDAAYARRYAQQ